MSRKCWGKSLVSKWYFEPVQEQGKAAPNGAAFFVAGWCLLPIAGSIVNSQHLRQKVGMRWQIIPAAAALALGDPVDHTARAQNRATENSTETQDRAAPPGANSLENSLARIAGAIEAAHTDPAAKREEQRSEADLQAQRDMAKWAWGAMGAAIASVLLTACGVFLIWRTLIHTRAAAQATQRMAFDTPAAVAAAVESNNEMREANKLARQALAAQNRPWVKAEFVSMDGVQLADDQINFWGNLRIENVGNRYARNIYVVPFGAIDDAQLKLDQIRDTNRGIPALQNPRQTYSLFPGESREINFGFAATWPSGVPEPDRAITPVIGAYVSYESDFSDGLHETGALQYLQRLWQGERMGFYRRNRDTDGADVEILKSVGGFAT